MQAWGAGTPATEPVGKNVLVWLDPTTGWRATLRDALGYSHDLAFDNYLPAAALFGDQPDRLDGLAEPVLGRALDDVKKDYRDSITIAGKDVVITLPPTGVGSLRHRIITLGIAAWRRARAVVRDFRSRRIPRRATRSTSCSSASGACRRRASTTS